MDKKKLLGSVGAEIWRDMLSGAVSYSFSTCYLNS